MNKRKCSVALIVATATSYLSSTANAEDLRFTIFGAENRINSQAVTDQLNGEVVDMMERSADADEKHGFVVGGGISSAARSGLTYGLELAYRRNGFDVSGDNQFVGTNEERSGRTSVMSAMLNADYEHSGIGEGAVSPFMNLGAGYARLRTVLENDDFKTVDNAPAFQVGGGLRFHHSDRLSTFLEYRYFRAIADGDNVDSDYVGHGVSIGLRF
ncbi:MAG: outer membrane beta-barrel protein [Pseudomonadota bacterium]